MHYWFYTRQTEPSANTRRGVFLIQMCVEWDISVYVFIIIRTHTLDSAQLCAHFSLSLSISLPLSVSHSMPVYRCTPDADSRGDK